MEFSVFAGVYAFGFCFSKFKTIFGCPFVNFVYIVLEFSFNGTDVF